MSMATQYEENTIACIYSGNIHVIIVIQRVLQSYKVKTEVVKTFLWYYVHPLKHTVTHNIPRPW